jgi:pyruvate, water dikinase
MPGDNIVWQVDGIADYEALVTPYAKAALESRRRLIYFRFASHEKLIPDDLGAEIHTLDPSLGFESFVAHVHKVIEDAGRRVIYVFDCLSELASTWSADQMLGNFFILTCPRLYDLETVTYFGIYRNYHASFALAPITETTQFLLDVFRHQGELYVRPIKVQHRSTSSMNTIHVWKGDEFRPITSSAVVSELLASSRWPGLRADTRVGFWRRIFNEAQQAIDDARAGLGQAQQEKEQAVFERLSEMVLSRDEAMLRLIHRYLSLADILEVRDRMIGIGLIGGKALGMLLARAILKRQSPRLHDLMETHDSFYIGSDVFYTFLIRNGVWWLRQKQRNPDTFLEGLNEAQARILQGCFPDYTLDQFMAMLDYFGESPYIVRSSSLLEDTYGNAFAGKYESVFCVNQGSREERLKALLDTVRKVYASAMSEEALRYRMNRGLLDRDEQMALLVMRVSGARYGDMFFPQIAGVGFSFNPYVWHKDIDPRAGVVRLVFGLGTRAVDRTDDDYTRLVALNAPWRRPEGNFDEVCEYSQHRVDYLDLAANRLVSGHFMDLVKECSDIPLELMVSRDNTAPQSTSASNEVLTFDRLLTSTPFVEDMREILKTLEDAYHNPVDVEFTANFLSNDRYKVNLLQCRPLQVQGMESDKLPRVEVRDSDRIVEARGAIIGPSRIASIDRFIYVVPASYGQLPVSVRYEVARLLGRINQTFRRDAETVMLLGPGRWGTASPELGVPVHFGEINRVSVLCEIVTMRQNLVPDVSLGTHFLNELVEMNVLYMALFPHQHRNYLNEEFFLKAPNRLVECVPSAARWTDTVRVIATKDVVPSDSLTLLMADAGTQEARIFRGNYEDFAHVACKQSLS